MPTETLSVIVPVFNNRDTLIELTRRIRQTIEGSGRTAELVLVDDCSTDDSWNVIAGIVRESAARILAIQPPHNLGQHAAILVGLHGASGEWCAVLDADLQDSPEAIADLLAASDGCDVVFAGRRGRHQGFARLVTGRLYRLMVNTLTGMPSDAGTFCVLRREAAHRVLALPVTAASFIAMMGLAGLRAKSIPIQREQRAAGRSAYSNRLRLRLAWQTLRCVIECRLFPARRAISATIDALSTTSVVSESARSGCSSA